MQFLVLVMFHTTRVRPVPRAAPAYQETRFLPRVQYPLWYQQRAQRTNLDSSVGYQQIWYNSFTANYRAPAPCPLLRLLAGWLAGWLVDWPSSLLFLLGLVDDGDNTLNNRRVRERRDVAQLILLARQDLAQDAAHDLAAARLGQVRDDVDGLG